jgi:septum formation protein
MPERLILASASAARAALLREAGIPFEVRPVSIDEARIKRLARAIGDTAIACALALAAEKARAISRHDPEALVIGADQILVADEEWFDKPTHLAEAKNSSSGCAAARISLRQPPAPYAVARQYGRRRACPN